jgi:transglutaminase-like putative cysteine protease
VSEVRARVGVRLALARPHVTAIGVIAVLLASLSIQPLLFGAWWVTRTVVVVTVVALAGMAVRALRLPAPLQPLLQAGILLVALTVLFAREQAQWGVLPGPDAIDRLRELAAQGRQYAEATVAPAGYDEGLQLLVVAGVGLIVLVVDTLAAGLDLPGLALVPLAALFVVPWAINRGSAPTWAFVLVAIGWLGLLSATQRDRAALWSPQARAGSAGGGLAVAAAATSVALVAGGLVALQGPVGPLGTGTGSGSGTVELDALVSLRRSLVTNDDRVVLTMATTSQRADYLRLAVLTDFDGEQWRPAPSTTLGPQPPVGPTGGAAGAGTGSLAEYRLDVGPLTGTTLPSPSGTITSLNDWPVVWDQRTSLPIRSDGSTIEGTRIGLVVAPASYDPDALRSASVAGAAPGSGFGEDAADPTPLVGEELPRLAREITAGTASPFDAAVALQDWFTSEGGFTYSTQVVGGASEDALATFLDERVGYCEQFAATMALMARSVGIPARVVVGFTQGRQDGTQWVVRGTDAHAWPELWMGTAGWVRFEPTPGAPTTTVPSYTRAVQPSQAPSADPSASATGPEASQSGVPAQVPQDGLGDAAGGGTGRSGVPVGTLVVVGLLGALLLLPALVRVVRRRRRMRAGDGERAYRELADTVVDLRLGTEGSTPRMTMAVVTALVGGEDSRVDEAATRILRAVEWQRYGSPEPAAAPLPVPPAGSGPSTAGRSGVGVLDRPEQPAATASAARPGALSGDVRVVRHALVGKAGWARRAGAVLLPRSVLAGLLAAASADRASNIEP